MAMLTPRFCLALLLAAAGLAAAPRSAPPAASAGALVLVNSQSPDFADFATLLEPYLRHFGVPYQVRDIARGGAGEGLEAHALLILGHRAFDPPRRFFDDAAEQALLGAVKSGAGLVSFDGLLAARGGREMKPLYGLGRALFGAEVAPARAEASEIVIPGGHWIAAQRPAPRTIKLKRAMPLPALRASGSTIVAQAGGQPLLLAAQHGSGRAVLFSSYEWVRPEVKGRLYGLDDLVWRSLVWAARKPFLMRSMPRFLAFRVDDVSGFGKGANAHLGWVETSNRHGLKPWLGIFIDDMKEDPEATARLAKLTQAGLATAMPHARRWPRFFYLEEPLLTDERGRNVAGKPWPDPVMAANFAEAEAFWKEHGIPRSQVALPHFYQFALNNFDGLVRWGAEFTGTVLTPGRGYGTPVPPAGPYLDGEPPRASSAPEPLYIADWLEIPGRPDLSRRFFNLVAEIRDVAGYEWAPSGVPVEEAIRRGVEQTRREFDSLLPGILFTHESDHIRHIQPEDWERILSAVMAQLEPERPVPVTLDELCRYARALHTSRLRRATAAAAEFDGAADVPTRFQVWSEGPQGPVAREQEAPPFRNGARVVLRP